MKPMNPYESYHVLNTMCMKSVSRVEHVQEGIFLCISTLVLITHPLWIIIPLIYIPLIHLGFNQPNNNPSFIPTFDEILMYLLIRGLLTPTLIMFTYKTRYFLSFCLLINLTEEIWIRFNPFLYFCKFSASFCFMVVRIDRIWFSPDQDWEISMTFYRGNKKLVDPKNVFWWIEKLHNNKGFLFLRKVKIF